MKRKVKKLKNSEMARNNWRLNLKHPKEKLRRTQKLLKKQIETSPEVSDEFE